MSTKATADWQTLTRLTQSAPLSVERVRLNETGIAIEGSFELPVLAQLPMEDQVFIAAFVRSHGSIKEMEKLFGISYPTVKNRLNRISDRLGGFVDLNPAPSHAETRADILARLESGELSASDALHALEALKKS